MKISLIKIKQLLFCTIGLLCITGSCYSATDTLPNLGSDSNLFTQQAEKSLQREFMRLLYQQVALIHDPSVKDYIWTLGAQLVAASDQPKKQYTFLIINDATINAFSGPNGIIGINSGLILKTRTEDELAAVIAHEIAHASQSHLARSLMDQKRLQIPTIAVLLAAVALGIQNPAAGLGLLAATEASAYQHALNYTRSREIEADRIGLQILTQAGFDPHNMLTFFERLAETERLNDNADIPQILRTHPLTAMRLADAKSYQVNNNKTGKPSNHLTFDLIQAKLRVQLTTDPRILSEQINTASSPTSIPNRYQKALTLLKLGKLNAANDIMIGLIKADSKQILFQLSQADIETSKKLDQMAQTRLSTLYQVHPHNYAVFMTFADFLMRHQQFSAARNVLHDQPLQYQNDKDYLIALSQAEGRSGNLATAYEVRSEIYLLTGNVEAAITQLKMALDYAQTKAYKRQLNRKLSTLQTQN